MKMNRTMIAAACLIAPLMVKAAPVSVEPLTSEERGQVAEWLDTQDHKSPRAMDCEGLTLDDTQKGQLKEAKFKFYKDMNLAKATFQNAMLDYGHTLSDAASTRDQGQAAGTALKDAGGAMADLKMNFELQVFYDILKPEQREPAMKCIMKKMKEMAQKRLEQACSRLKPTPAPSPAPTHP